MAKKTVNISGMAFSPPTISVKAGDCVCWTNNDSMAHTVAFDRTDPDAVDIPSDSGQLSPGQSFDATFPTAGTYPYHCANHPSMKGTVVVS